MVKKKLLILNTDEFSYSYGGVCQFKRNMDEYLQEAFDIEYMVMPQSAFKKSKDELFSLSARIMALLPGPRRLRYMVYLWLNYIKITKADFILSHGPEGSFVASFTNVPFAHIYHGNSNPMTISKFWFGKYFRRMYDKMVERIDRTCPLVYSVGPRRNAKQKKINNPLNQNVKPIEKTKRHGFFFAGRLEAMKNVDRMITIYGKLDDSIRKDNPFYIIGYGSQEESLKALAREIKPIEGSISTENDTNVIFLGKIDTTMMLSTDVDKKVLLMASDTEGMPTAIAEAFSAGLPVVVTEVGDIPSVVRNGENGYMVPLGFTDEEYIDKIMTVLSDYERFSDNAYESSKIFNREIITKSVIQDINNLIEK